MSQTAKIGIVIAVCIVAAVIVILGVVYRDQIFTQAAPTQSETIQKLELELNTLRQELETANAKLSEYSGKYYTEKKVVYDSTDENDEPIQMEVSCQKAEYYGTFREEAKIAYLSAGCQEILDELNSRKKVIEDIEKAIEEKQKEIASAKGQLESWCTENELGFNEESKASDRCICISTAYKFNSATNLCDLRCAPTETAQKDEEGRVSVCCDTASEKVSTEGTVYSTALKKEIPVLSCTCKDGYYNDPSQQGTCVKIQESTQPAPAPSGGTILKPSEPVLDPTGRIADTPIVTSTPSAGSINTPLPGTETATGTVTTPTPTATPVTPSVSATSSPTTVPTTVSQAATSTPSSDGTVRTSTTTTPTVAKTGMDSKFLIYVLAILMIGSGWILALRTKR